MGPERTIALVGLMGAGKSSVGRRLAERLRLPFRDSDREIEEAAGCPITEIFERFGEAGFRRGELRVIKRLLRAGPGVLATGGGAFVDVQVRRLILDEAISVWLRADLDILVGRVARSLDRPLLRDGNPRDIMEQLILERYPVYALSDIVVESGSNDHDTVVESIVSALNKRLPP